MTEPTTTTQAHGPGGLLATPGLGLRRKGQKWGVRRKDYGARAGGQIKGNLYRGGDGKFAAGGGGASSPKTGGGVKLSKPTKLTAPKAPKAAPAKRSGGKGRKGGGGGKPKKTEAQRAAERAEKKKQREAEQAKKREAKKQQAAAEKKANQEKVAADAGLGKNLDGALSEFASPDEKIALAPHVEAAMRQRGLIEGPASDPRISAAGRAYLEARDSGDVSRARDALSRASERSAKQTATQQRQAERAAARAKREAERAKKAKKSGGANKQPAKDTSARDAARAQRQQEADARRQAGEQRRQAGEQRRQANEAARTERTQRQLTDLAQRAEAGTKLSDSDWSTLAQAGLASRAGAFVSLNPAGRAQARRAPSATKSFAVFKDASGRHRWVARTTTAYKDRDGEILSTAGLDADSQRMRASGQFGPLRWWHVGEPDPTSADAPWGPGLDLGDCDYSTVIGRTRIESGTFKSAALGQAVAAIADQLELSPGFFHPYGSNGPVDGVFETIRTFERSLVPIRYGRASNYFTGITVKETRMDMPEIERRLKAMLSELQLTPDQAEAVVGGWVAGEKAAQAQQAVYKSAELPDVVINGVTYKAMPAIEEKAPMPPAEMVVAGEDEAADGLAEEDAGDAVYVGDMTRDELKMLFAEAIAEFGGGITTKMGEMDEMLKGLGYARAKEAQTAETQTSEIAALKAQQAQIAARLAELAGDARQVATPNPLDDVIASALKSGPTVAADAQAPTTPAGATLKRLIPEAYGPNGWQSAS